ncbi:MAG: ExbD/TolR family protein [Plesiomonas sp.]|uniref:ExbD/TolR family protein n=1 Tax=Plesiomonas sp. TaxID=2486279 RepID=UPI003F38CD51
MIRDRSSDHMQPSVGIDLTPLLDIIFIVLVFLLLTANVRLQSMEIDLPEIDNTQSAAPTEQQPLTLHLLASEPYWALNDHTYRSWEMFSQALLQRHQQLPNASIIIAADRNVSAERLLNLLNFLQQQHIPAAQILTKGTK